MGFKGKLVRHDSQGLVFGSRYKPEWRPMYPAENLDTSALTVGEYYDIEAADNRVLRLTKLPPMGGNTGGPAHVSGFQPLAPNPQYTQPQPAQQATSGFNGSLMASATGFAKSAMEGGQCKTTREAMLAALEWAALWDANAPKWPSPKLSAAPEPAVAPASIDPNDDIPF